MNVPPPHCGLRVRRTFYRKPVALMGKPPLS